MIGALFQEETMRLIAILFLLLWVFEITVQAVLGGHIHPLLILGLTLFVLVITRRQ